MNTESPHPMFDEWIAVQAEAIAAERELMHAQIEHAFAYAPPVSPEALEHARILRQRSTALLYAALAEMSRLARG